MSYFSEFLTTGQRTDAAQEPREPLACGWFDSSHDLQRGLLVQEHASLDALAGTMSLSDWLAWHAVSNPVTPPG
jgi:hypothetical protein